MQSRLVAGVVAGFAGGVVFGLMMTMMTAPAPDGGRVPMMAMVAQVVGSASLGVGWAYHLFNSALIGGLFGWILGPRVRGTLAGAGWGALYGFVWWVLGALVLMPILLGMPAFAPPLMAPMRPVAAGSLVGHVVFGVVLGVAFVWLRDRRVGHVGAEAVTGR
jgi:hypothetical protein